LSHRRANNPKTLEVFATSTAQIAAGRQFVRQCQPPTKELSMISTKLITAAALALAVTLPAMPAQAGAPRTFVSAAGTDNSTCSFAAPCRHFQNAVDATSAGGEVDALDPAGYGPITINHAVTIEGQGWSYIAPPVNGNGITINVGSGNVVIHGVSVNGAGISGGTNGIVFNSGSGLTVTDCVLQNFSNSGAETTGDGILMQPSAGTAIIFISNTTVANNGFVGLFYWPPGGSTATASVTIDRVVAIINGVNAGGGGITVNIGNGGAATTFSITNATANNNEVGISVVSATTALTGTIDNSTANNNHFDGIFASGATKVTLSRLTAAGNGQDGIDNLTTSNTVYSFGNNQVGLNHTDFGGTLNKTMFTLQ
jgi:hypothetical protein